MSEPTPGRGSSPDPDSFIESTLPRLLDEFDAERSGRVQPPDRGLPMPESGHYQAEPGRVSSTGGWTQCEHMDGAERCGLVAFTGHTMCPEHVSSEEFAKSLGLDVEGGSW